MSCAEPTPPAIELLHRLAKGSLSEEIIDPDVVASLVFLGWAFTGSGMVELTGIGLAHVDGRHRGVHEPRSHRPPPPRLQETPGSADTAS